MLLLGSGEAHASTPRGVLVIAFLFSIMDSSSGMMWTGDEVRTWLLGVMTGMVGLALRVLWTLRDDVRDMKQAVPKIEKGLELHEKEIRWLTSKRIAQEAIEEAERQNYQGHDRRRELRRDRDIVNEALRTDEHPIEEQDP
jgi:hypothetical protein